MVGVVIEQEVDFFEYASHEVLLNGDNQWELDLHSDAAEGLCVYFNDFHIPVGGELYIESPEGAFDVVYMDGPIDHTENNDHKKWTSSDIPGNTIKLVYRQSAAVLEMLIWELWD